MSVTPVLLDTVRYQPRYTLAVGGAQLYHLVELPPHALGFIGAQVAFRAFDPHYFTGARNLEAALGAFMSLKFWHSGFPFLQFLRLFWLLL